jgi:hypothetical protein
VSICRPCCPHHTTYNHARRVRKLKPRKERSAAKVRSGGGSKGPVKSLQFVAWSPTTPRAPPKARRAALTAAKEFAANLKRPVAVQVCTYRSFTNRVTRVQDSRAGIECAPSSWIALARRAAELSQSLTALCGHPPALPCGLPFGGVGRKRYT